MGGTLGHCLCTGLAVVGGRMIAQKISVRTGEMLLSLEGGGEGSTNIKNDHTCKKHKYEEPVLKITQMRTSVSSLF